MIYTAPEKLEIVRVVEQPHLPTRITPDKWGIRFGPQFQKYVAIWHYVNQALPNLGKANDCPTPH